MSNFFDPWNHTSYGENAMEVVNGVVEIPKGTHAKYELDKELGMLKLHRVLYASKYNRTN